MAKKTMLFFIFVYLAEFNVQADILTIDCRAGNIIAVESGFSSENFMFGFRWRDDKTAPDRFIFKSGILGFGNAHYSGFLQLYFAKNPATSERLYSSAGARIYGNASADSFVVSAVTPWTVYVLACRNDSADNIFSVTMKNLDAGLIISRNKPVAADDYFTDEITCASIIRPFADLHFQTDILGLYIAASLNCSANLPLSALISAGLAADTDDFSCNFTIVYWSDHYVDSTGKMPGRFAENSISLQKLFGKFFSISLSNHLILEKIPSYEMYSESANIGADNETTLSAFADPFSFLCIFAKSGLSAVNTEFDNLELKHAAGFRIEAGILSLSFTVRYRETKFISEYSFLALLDLDLKHADITFAWKPAVYFRTAVMLSWPEFSCRIGARIYKDRYEAELGISLKNL